MKNKIYALTIAIYFDCQNPLHFFSSFLYQKYTFESAVSTRPPTPLRIAEIFVGLVRDDERSMVISDEETKASLDTLITQV